MERLTSSNKLNQRKDGLYLLSLASGYLPSIISEPNMPRLMQTGEAKLYFVESWVVTTIVSVCSLYPKNIDTKSLFDGMNYGGDHVYHR